MNDLDCLDLKQVKNFVAGCEAISFQPIDTNECYKWIARTLKRFGYFKLSKKDKSSVRAYISKVTGYSRAQLTRLISQYRDKKWIGAKSHSRNCFAPKYTREDILLLAETDACHQTLSGQATKKLFDRAYTIFRDNRYAKLKNISVAHIYNLRKSLVYTNKRRFFTDTKRSLVAIGERRKPKPNGSPGYLRIDTVHQGDQDKEKGVYYINAVDEVTQMEVVCAVEKISERYLMPVLEQLIEAFPFKIVEMHSDNGSEYINAAVAKLLNKLLIELTKSRARQTNDNALVESKNGSIIRKCLGYCHISQKHAPIINNFLKNHLIPYINYHRPCYYPVIKTDEKTGKQKKTYPYDMMMTPYEKLKSLPDAAHYLKGGINFSDLDLIATKETDLEVARKLKNARERLFQNISAIN